MATKTRCGWCGDDPVVVEYHDKEWGVPVRDGRERWETLVIDGFQAGLSWRKDPLQTRRLSVCL